MECRRCTSTTAETVIMSTGKHYAKEVCTECGDFVKWVKKPYNEGRRTKGSKYSPSKLGVSCCELCRREKSMLANNQTLEVHHKDHDPENDVPKNLMVLCTFCHKQVHAYSLYLNDHYIDKGEISDEH